MASIGRKGKGEKERWKNKVNRKDWGILLKKRRRWGENCREKKCLEIRYQNITDPCQGQPKQQKEMDLFFKDYYQLDNFGEANHDELHLYDYY